MYVPRVLCGLIFSPWGIAEAEGFEPPEPCLRVSTVFKTATIDHSVTPPVFTGNVKEKKNGFSLVCQNLLFVSLFAVVAGLEPATLRLKI